MPQSLGPKEVSLCRLATLDDMIVCIHGCGRTPEIEPLASLAEGEFHG